VTRNFATKKKGEKEENFDKITPWLPYTPYRIALLNSGGPSLSIVSASYRRTVTIPRFEFEFEEGREGYGRVRRESN